ncbi:MAG TPA: type II toxin-antitoxin system VapC family toxin [Anaeromyxobacteraceae bacterium]|nr:type II toxin-antitoxin system VapC family toxin [Anaeromyxobacteraceae bacterium]
MIAFLDSSVVLRRLFGEPDSLSEWPAIREAWASRLLGVEVGRVIDRTRLAGEIDDEQVVELQHESRRALRSVQIVGFSDRILERAAGPMPTALGSLDAIHLATALEIVATRVPRLVVATHDRLLARAARASGLDVVGV